MKNRAEKCGFSSRETLPSEIVEPLQAAGWLGNAPEVKALTGGVSSEIWRVRDQGRSFVVKRALAKLKVAEEWRADVGRNRYEQEYLRQVGAVFPEAVPRILLADEAWDFFVMEYLDEEFADWKNTLMAGRLDPGVATVIGRTLGRIHGWSWGHAALAGQFATGSNFHELRVAPYLLASAERHPEWAPSIREEAGRLIRSRRALVHGDFSPKNLMVGAGRVLILDCEVAWYGDPAFDVSFLLTHLLLKSLWDPGNADGFMLLVDRFLEAYASEIGAEKFSLLGADCPRLLLCLLLARVDGKSPVEYLTREEEKERVRRFVGPLFAAPQDDLFKVLDLWRNAQRP